MNILERINSALKGPVLREADDDDNAVDMSSQADRMRAIEHCRGPCIGWEDYISGNDYVPPRYYLSDRPYGPKDTGKHGITSTQQEANKLEFDGPNPFSRKHGGVRPWAPGELLLTLMSKVGGKGVRGKLYEVAKGGIVKRAALATHGKYDEYDIDNSIQQGAAAVLQILQRDEARLGTKFTNFIGAAVQQAMKAGVPPGYGDEYRRVRGLRRHITPMVKAALRDAKNGEPLETHIVNIRREFAKINKCPKCSGTGEIEDESGESLTCNKCVGRGTPQPGPSHPYGLFPPQLFEVRDSLIRAINTGSAKTIKQALDDMEKTFDDIGEIEERNTSPGVTTQGAVGKKSREQGTLIAFNRAAGLMQTQRDLAKEAIAKLKRGESIDDLVVMSDRLWTNFKTTSPGWHRGKKDEVKTHLVDPAELESKIEAHLDPNESKEPKKSKKGYTSPFEQRQDDLPGSPGFVGLLTIKSALEDALRSNDISKLEDFISMSEHEQRALKVKEEVEVIGIKASSIMTRNRETGKEKERMNLAGVERNVDSLHSKETREKIEMAIEQVSPWRDDTMDRKNSATEAIEIINEISDVVDGYIEARSEKLDTTKLDQDLRGIAKDLGSSLGEYQEEIVELLNMVAGTIKIGGGFSDIKNEIRDLLKIAKQDTKIQMPADSVTPKQYRILLRLFGVKNYPERGTPNDPEINEKGGKSRWAEFGYPPVADAVAGKKANVYLWHDIFETIDPDTGEPTPSCSNANIARQKGEALGKFTAAVAKIQQQLGESLGYDSVECKMLTEFHLLLCRMIIEDVLPGGIKLIFG